MDHNALRSVVVQQSPPPETGKGYEIGMSFTVEDPPTHGSSSSSVTAMKVNISTNTTNTSQLEVWWKEACRPIPAGISYDQSKRLRLTYHTQLMG